MIDIVGFLKAVVDELNTGNIVDCDGCYYYGAPLTESAKELQQVPDDKCDCKLLYLTRYNYRLVEQRNPLTQLISTVAINHFLTIEVVVLDNIAKNNYNEMNEYPISESRWETILKPIQFCFTKENFFNALCSAGYDLQATDFTAEMVFVSASNNYTGWKFNVTLKENV